MEPSELLDKVRRRDFSVGIIGLGRVGLPLALAYASQGVPVIGVDLDKRRLADIERGVMPFKEDGAEEVLQQLKGTDRLRVSDNFGSLRAADAIFVTVGTTLNTEFRPDYTQVQGALSALAGVLRPVQILMMRSTVSPGTLTKTVKPFMENDLKLRVGKDILLASTPERIAAGKALVELPTLPEIVGGIDDLSSEVAAETLRALGPDKKVHITSSTGAELTKLFNNVYRYVTFALANEFALMAEVYEVDAQEIIGIATHCPCPNVATRVDFGSFENARDACPAPPATRPPPAASPAQAARGETGLPSTDSARSGVDAATRSLSA